MYVAVRGWEPDLDPTEQGRLVDVTDMYPTVKGMAGRPAPVNSTLPALTGTCVGAVTLAKLDGTTRTFAGTTTEVFEAGTTSWTDRTRSSGDYTGANTARMRFAQFNDSSFMAIDGAVINTSTTAEFSDVSGAPVASIIESVGDFVIAFDTNEATFGDSPNRWWCCAIGNPLSWIPSIATQCASGLIQSTPGVIRAAHQIGNQVAAYKDESLYIGRYTGPPSVWAFDLVTEQIGSFSQEAVISVGNAHFFPGAEDFYVFDGTRPVAIGAPVREWFSDNVSFANRTKIWGQHDRANSRVLWYFPSLTGTGSLDSVIAYNYRSGRWGKGTISIEAATSYVTPGITYDNLGSAYSTYDDIPGFAYDSGFFTASEEQIGIINTSHRFQLLNGPSASCAFITWDIGQDGSYSFLSRVRPRFTTNPTTGGMLNSWRENESDSWTSSSSTATLTNGKFDVERESRWHSLNQNFTGDVEITGLDIEIQQAGLE